MCILVKLCLLQITKNLTAGERHDSSWTTVMQMQTAADCKSKNMYADMQQQVCYCYRCNKVKAQFSVVCNLLCDYC